MIEQQAETKRSISFKKFKRKAKVEPVINEDNPFANSRSPITESAPQLSFVEKLNVLIEGSSSSRPMTQRDVLNGVAEQFQAPKIIDWSENTGRFALVETVLKRNELEFVAMRQRMEAMAGDPDACGGRNEMGNGNKVLELGSNKITNLSNFEALKNSGDKNHTEGKHDHCSNCGEDLKEGKCGKCAA